MKTCGDCIHAEICEGIQILPKFNRENPAYCKGFRAEQRWIPVSEPPKEHGYYLCVILSSAVGNKKEYRRKILFWEDNVWIEMASCFRTVKPVCWMPLPEPPKEGE